jgi:hypothetical protein
MSLVEDSQQLSTKTKFHNWNFPSYEIMYSLELGTPAILCINTEKYEPDNSIETCSYVLYFNDTVCL